MPGITNPAEEYFKDGTWAWDPAGSKWLKLIIDPLTNRLVIDHPGDLEVVQPVPNDLRVGNYGWDGSAWRKLPLVWGYSTHWQQEVIGTAVGAGNAVAYTTAVDAGYVHVLQQVSAYHNAGAAKTLAVAVIKGAVRTYLMWQLAAASLARYPLTCNLALVEGDKVEITAYAVGDGKKAYLSVWGYKMKITE